MSANVHPILRQALRGFIPIAEIDLPTESRVSPAFPATMECSACGQPTLASRINWIGSYAVCGPCTDAAAGIGRAEIGEWERTCCCGEMLFTNDGRQDAVRCDKCHNTK